jgi:hypothetical protein
MYNLAILFNLFLLMPDTQCLTPQSSSIQPSSTFFNPLQRLYLIRRAEALFFIYGRLLSARCWVLGRQATSISVKLLEIMSFYSSKPLPEIEA